MIYFLQDFCLTWSTTSLKNRYNDPTAHRKFVVGIDRSKMRLYDLEDSAQSDLILPEDDVGSSNKEIDFSGFQI